MWEILGNQLQSSAGAVLVALLLMSIAGLAISLVKVMQFRRDGVGRIDEGAGALDAHEGPSSLRDRVFASASAAFASGDTDAETRERAAALAQETAIDGLGRLSRHLAFLDAIVQAAPMLGLLGTVFGMIEVFFTMSGAEGAIDPALLSGGIFAALITTAAGLVVAIPFFFAAAYFEAALDAETRAIESLILRTIHGAPARSRGSAHRILPADLAPDEAPPGHLGQALARPN